MWLFNMAAAPESVWSLTAWGLLTPAFVFVFFCLNILVVLVVAAMLFHLMVILSRCVGIEFMFDAPQEEGARVQAQNRGEAAAKQNAGVETRSRTRTPRPTPPHHHQTEAAPCFMWTRRPALLSPRRRSQRAGCPSGSAPPNSGPFPPCARCGP